MNKELAGKANSELGSRSTSARASMSCLIVLNGTHGSLTIKGGAYLRTTLRTE